LTPEVRKTDYSDAKSDLFPTRIITRFEEALATVSSTNPFIASKLSLLVMSKVSNAPIALNQLEKYPLK
jgi:hypothetical protein